jgi:hypothetical protein
MKRRLLNNQTKTTTIRAGASTINFQEAATMTTTTANHNESEYGFNDLVFDDHKCCIVK